MELQRQIQELAQRVHDHMLSIEELEYEVESLGIWLEQQELRLRNLRNEG